MINNKMSDDNMDQDVDEHEDEEEEIELENAGNMDIVDRNSLMCFGGYILFKTIKSRSFCTACINNFVEKDPAKQLSTTNSSTSLIAMKSFSRGALTTPSEQSCSMFKICEHVFKINEEKLRKMSKILDFLTDKTLKIQTILQMHPRCHLRVIIKRFFRARLFVWAKHRSQQLRQEQKKTIASESNSSKSMKRHAMIK